MLGSVFISEMRQASDVSARRDFCYFLCGALQDCSQKGLTVDLKKSPGLGLFGKSGSRKTTTLLLSLFGSILAGGSLGKSTWWTVRTRFQALSTSCNAPLGSSDVPFYARPCCAAQWSNEKQRQRGSIKSGT